MVPKATSSARFFTKAGLVEDMKAKIDDYQAKEKLKGIVATPPGVPPPVRPSAETGFVRVRGERGAVEQ